MASSPIKEADPAVAIDAAFDGERALTPAFDQGLEPAPDGPLADGFHKNGMHPTPSANDTRPSEKGSMPTKNRMHPPDRGALEDLHRGFGGFSDRLESARPSPL